jgi:hypothetical protein
LSVVAPAALLCLAPPEVRPERLGKPLFALAIIAHEAA